MLPINDRLFLSENEIHFEFIRSPGPGGQNVNKVATAVQLRFNILKSSLPGELKERLFRRARNRVSREGDLLITAHRSRSQDQNKRDALNRLIELIRSVVKPPKIRKPTRPSLAAKKRRLREKRRRAQLKENRRDRTAEND